MNLVRLDLKVIRENRLLFQKCWLEDLLVIREIEVNTEDLDHLVQPVCVDLQASPVFLASPV